MKKRILSIILAIIMIVSLVACGTGQGSTNTQGTEGKNTQVEESEGGDTQGEDTQEKDTQNQGSEETDTGSSENQNSENEESETEDKGTDDSEIEDQNTEDKTTEDSEVEDSEDKTTENTGSEKEDTEDKNSETNKEPENSENEKDTSTEDAGNTGNTESGGNTGNNGNNDNSGNTGNTGNTGNNDNNQQGSNPTPPPTPTPGPVTTIYVNDFTAEENRLADNIIAQIINDSMDDFQMAKAIHDWLVMNVTYDYQNYLNGTLPDSVYTAEGAMKNKRAVCDGYSKSFLLMCTKVGVECIRVTGTGNGEPHAWNQVKIAGKWYNVDVTWDDPATLDSGNGPQILAPNDHSACNYQYFCVPDSLFGDHRAESAKNTCNSSSLFERCLKAGVPWNKATYVATKAELINLIKAEAKKGNYQVEFYIKGSLMNSEQKFLLNCVVDAKVGATGLNYSYFTYFENSTDPGTYYLVNLNIHK